MAGLVRSSKLDAPTPVTKLTPISVTVSRAPFRFPSVSVAGLEANDAPAVTVTLNVRLARSVLWVFTSESVAVTVTVTAPEVAALGVPQTSRASLPGQPGESAPVSSKRSPVGRPEAA